MDHNKRFYNCILNGIKLKYYILSTVNFMVQRDLIKDDWRH